MRGVGLRNTLRLKPDMRLRSEASNPRSLHGVMRGVPPACGAERNGP